MTTIIGIDYSGAKGDRNTWVAQGRLTPEGALEFDSANMIHRRDVVNLLSSVSTPVIAAIDFPFGVPSEFAEFLNVGSEIETMLDAWRIIEEMSLDDFIAARNAFVSRFGEPKRAGDETHFSESFSPLHKVNPNMLPMTYYGIAMLHELHESHSNRWLVPPLRSSSDAEDRTVTLLETMPGAFLKAIGTIHRGYKNARPRELRDERRDIILDALRLKSGIALPNLDALRDGCLASDDCLDAVVAAVAAAAWAQNPARFRHPDASELAAATLEGWIYVPQSDA